MEDHESRVEYLRKYKTRFESCSKDDLMRMVDYLEGVWLEDNNGQKDLVTPQQILKKLNIQAVEEMTYMDIDECVDLCKVQVYLLIQKLMVENIIPRELKEDEINEIYTKMFRIAQRVHYGCKMLLTSWVYTDSDTALAISKKPDVGLDVFYNSNDKSEINAFQDLAIFITNKIYEMGLRRSKDHLYEKVYTKKNGWFTHSWKQHCPIKDFIYKQTPKGTNYGQWKNATSNPSNPSKVCEYIMNCVDPMVKDLQKNRHVWSFKNGIYVAMEWDDEHEMFTDHFYEYGAEDVLDADVVSSKYFPTDFDNFDDVDEWWDIPTPTFQAILDYQDFPRDVCEWIYIFLGRVLYDIGELDDWQMALFLQGVGRSGKSTITKVIKKFYDSSDVGVLSNNVEKKFGLSSLMNKLLILAPEIKSDFGLEQTDFQLLVEGGDMQVAIKHQASEYIIWNTPVLFAGNEPPGFTDNSLSVSRRILVAKFNNRVTNADPDLQKKLDKELPRLLKKMNCAYLSAIHKFKGKDIWKMVPEYFRQTQQEMAQSTNSLQHFLNSGKVIFKEDLYCFMQDFQREFNEHVKESSLPRHKWTSDFYQGVFSQYDLKIVRKKKRYPNNENGNWRNGNFIIGLDLIGMQENLDEEI